MLSIILNLLPKIPAVIAALPEFAALVSHAKTTMTETDQVKLKTAYELAKQGSDTAHEELQELVRTHTD